ncbi:MAG TPA: TlpA family protein disulfide reductase, partial [Planctomycetaceae bacterium]|nr:TlpA family protein disulfide reductase [Planctomycetaceae bacterium]
RKQEPNPFSDRHELFADKGVVVIGIHHNSVPLEEVRAFAQEKGLTFPIGLDNVAGETFGRYNVSALPGKMLIGPDGRVIADAIRGDNLLWKLWQVALYPESEWACMLPLPRDAGARGPRRGACSAPGMWKVYVLALFN